MYICDNILSSDSKTDKLQSQTLYFWFVLSIFEKCSHSNMPSYYYKIYENFLHYMKIYEIKIALF